MLNQNMDRLFDKKTIEKGSFSFDQNVAAVFDDMITRSVPYFDQIQKMIIDFAKRYTKKNSLIYDFGCSTGLTLFKLMDELKENYHYVGLDNSEHMLTVAKKRLATLSMNDYLNLNCVNLNSIKTFNDAGFGIFNLILQFLPIEKRRDLLSLFYNSLLPNGAIVVVEKVVFLNSDLNQIYIEQFRKFKQQQGYSMNEILLKEKALDGVLNPLTIEENKLLFKDAGFSIIETFFQWYNFVGILAIKTK